MNTVWVLLIVTSVFFSFLNGRLGEFTKSIFEGAKSAVEVGLFLLGIVSLWLGITRIIEDSGLIHRLSGLFQYFVRRLFKNIPPDHLGVRLQMIFKFVPILRWLSLFGMGVVLIYHVTFTLTQIQFERRELNVYRVFLIE